MASAYDHFGIRPNASLAELDAAYAAKVAEYDPDRAAQYGEEFVALAQHRRAELGAMYRELRAILATPSRLEGAAQRRRERETMVALVVFVALALIVPLVSGIAVPTRTVVASGADDAALTANVAPPFELGTLNGQDVSLADYKGKVVILNFWATWCPPCVREVPRLIRISETYKDQGVVMLGINTTFQDDVAKVQRFVNEQGISYPVLLDPAATVSEEYRVRLMPTTFILDREGRIIHSKVGEIDEATLEGYVRTLLSPPEGASQ